MLGGKSVYTWAGEGKIGISLFQGTGEEMVFQNNQITSSGKKGEGSVAGWRTEAGGGVLFRVVRKVEPG